MAFDENLAGRIRDCLGKQKGITEKKMFGGLGVMLHGNMLVGVWKESLIVRLDPDDWHEALQEAHVREFDITGRSMRGWLMVEPEGLEEEASLSSWIERALAFVETLPSK